MSFDFFALNWTFHLCAQSDIFTKSLLICAEVSAGSVLNRFSIRQLKKVRVGLDCHLILAMRQPSRADR